MFKYLGMAMLAVCCFAFQGKAVDGVGLIIPYKVECVKKSDGTKVIQVSACLRTTKKGLVVDDLVSNEYVTDDGNFKNSSLTTILQSKDACATLDAMVKVDGKLYGYPAQKISGDETYTFGFPAPDQFIEKTADVCVFFVNVTGCACKGDDKSFAKDHLRVDQGDTLDWVSLNYTGSDIDAFEDSPYNGDDLLVAENFYNLDTALAIEDYLVRLALQKLHGTACCFPSFGMNDESMNALTLQILDKMQACPQDFNAKGKWGSCGDTASVKVTGTMTKPIIIDVCGKKLCFTPLSSLNDQGQETGLNPTQCFEKFFANFSANVLSDDPSAFKCGRDHEICRLVNGFTLAFDGEESNLELFHQLRLICIDADKHIYGFVHITTGYNGPNDVASFTDLGCRFTLDDCPKCCK